ncbi:globin family protein [Mesorhizobium sp.]|uniref:globin family protein n=1 Tax=Mesorhizobium sp. TaxID=1871066 RepID=UPI0012259A22|nr:globin family protein [Mesorhizobium sp.]TIO10462.1 MAG: hemin receptor [Mesorhizobium sp.]TIO36801.1 MAG: hemin receptor [Mesorhizobium sp.]TIP13834.1 MAG: hemin receptor [Mesorhizobium sp.]
MTPDQIRLVQDSFREVLPIRVAAAALFYERLFAIDSNLRALFLASDMPKQGAELMASLGSVVRGLDRASTVLPIVRELAKRHAAYGFKEHHYPIVGQAFIDTLAAGLGTAFTPAVREAWEAAYALLASVMIAAAHEDQLAA